MDSGDGDGSTLKASYTLKTVKTVIPAYVYFATRAGGLMALCDTAHLMSPLWDPGPQL